MRLALLRRYFLRGLAFLLPAVITIWLLVFLGQKAYGFVAEPFYVQVLQAIGHIFEGAEEHPIVRLLVLVLVVASLVGFVVLFGMTASTVIGRRTLRYGERLMNHVPLVKAIYPATKQVIDFFVKPKDRVLGSVVLVPFPHKGSYALGFVTGREVEPIKEAVGKKLLNVLVPFTPTMSGILLLVPEEDVVYVDLPPDEALKFITSGGVITPQKAEELEAEETLALPSQTDNPNA